MLPQMRMRASTHTAVNKRNNHGAFIAGYETCFTATLVCRRVSVYIYIEIEV